MLPIPKVSPCSYYLHSTLPNMTTTFKENSIFDIINISLLTTNSEFGINYGIDKEFKKNSSK